MQVLRPFVLLCILAQLGSAATKPSATRRTPSAAGMPNVIVITLDTTRADRMGFLGSKLGLTPNLDELAGDSVAFERAFSQIPLTTPSHANIFTGTYPQYDHLTYMGQPLAKDLPYLPDILRQRGYGTAAVVGSSIIDAHNPVASGFDRGFDTYDADFHNRKKGEDRYKSLERRAEVVVDRSLAWVDAHHDRPFFLWVHCYDPHAPYDPPEPYKTRYADALYDGEIAYTDWAMGKFLQGLKARGLYEGSLIALMADHGEGLGDHGEQHHGIFLYDETLHVPLLFKLPKQRLAGSRVQARVQLVDVSPTILSEVGIPVPNVMQGQSLLGMMQAASKPAAITPAASTDRPAYAETDYARRAFGWSTLRAWRTGKYLYIDAPKRELYDQSTDPGAKQNKAADSQAVADTMQSQIDAFRHKTTNTTVGRASLSPEQSESLRALGYVGADTGPIVEGADRGPDPKDKIAVAELMDDALGDIQNEDYPAAIPKLQQLIVEEPNTPLAYLELGRAYLTIKEYQKALPLLQTAVKKLPDDNLAHYKLAEALAKTGDWNAALVELKSLIAKSPKSPKLRISLGLAYEKTNQFPQAIEEYRTILKAEPDNFGVNLMLGRLLGSQGKMTEALPYLRKAVTLDPDSKDAHIFLANVYEALGQSEKALRERLAAEHGKAFGGPE